MDLLLAKGVGVGIVFCCKRYNAVLTDRRGWIGLACVGFRFLRIDDFYYADDPENKEKAGANANQHRLLPFSCFYVFSFDLSHILRIGKIRFINTGNGGIYNSSVHEYSSFKYCFSFRRTRVRIVRT